MAVVTDKAIEVVERFLKLIKSADINIERIILFGSYAKGNAGEWSDMDIAIVSPDFSGMPFYDRKMLNSFILKIDSRIEVHPFRPEDFTEDNLFVKEILKNGMELKV
ncbi:MAG TPA: nucleotidyltransferase domain-containing protein [Nitrospirae bacterium]|nr:nucleotidyltransferase domain protein [bacterium BMS3Abin06]HDH12347.1 nucleotidyltransferase domain-containing protein [Nitrospirota bacterium]HDZ00362.1 nucleotidyltransferase domain-containing protein [Nitrospirota bacterium]